jgi:hypothetical protein
MIDTLKISKDLENATLTKAQADGIAEAIMQVTSSDLVSKADLKDLELRLIKEMGGLRDRVNTILWAILGVGVVTWILQFFGASIRHLFGQ